MRSLCLVALAVGGLLLSACETPAGVLTDASRAAPPAGDTPPPPPTEPALLDESVEAAVQRSLRRAVDDDVSALRVDVERGVVTLRGIVADLVTKDVLTDRARALRGVVGVVDLLEVRPEDRPDEEVAHDVRAALAARPSTRDLDVEVEVEGGRVTLRGEVERYSEEQLALDVARGVRGVRLVEDAVEVRRGLRPEGEELAAEVRSLLEMDARVGHRAIEVAAEGREVRLSGEVGSALEKARAVEGAYAAGARRVAAEGLDVRPVARERVTARQRPPAPAVERALEEALARDARVPPGVSGSVAEGVATLRGETRTLEQKRAAEEAARGVVGVLSVQNDVDVEPLDLVTDDEIARRLELLFASDPWLSGHGLTVLVEDGEVALYGEVGSRYVAARAVRLAGAIEGVEEVDPRIEVYGAREMTDAELREAVLEALFWNPFVDPADIDVEVQGGAVWLRGQTWEMQGRTQARESAFLAGARSVHNEIEVVTSPPDIPDRRENRPSYLQREPLFGDTPFNTEGGAPH